jgi:hypothetical protein
MLEDAIRTASLPGLPPGGLTLIRKLELGRIRIADNASALSQQIDERILSVRPFRVSSGAEEQPEAPAVYFDDLVEPWVLCARLLARGARPSSWYWPLAMPGSADCDLNPAPNALVALLLRASLAEFGMTTVAGVIDELVTKSGVDTLLQAMTGQDAGLVLSNLGAQVFLDSLEHPRQSVVITPVPLTLPWQLALGKWVPNLGVQDKRAILLSLAGAYRNDVATAAFTAGAILHRAADGVSLAGGESTGDGAQCPPTQTQSQESPVKPTVVVDVPEARLDSPMVEPGPVGTNPAAACSADRSENSDCHPVGPPCDHAGLLFLVTVLQRLGIAKTLEDYPLLAELNLPGHILVACANRLGIGAQEITRQAISPAEKLPHTELPSDFIAAAAWPDLLLSAHRASRLRLHRTPGGRKLLCDDTGTLVLAMWQGETPQGVDELCLGRQVHHGLPLQDLNELRCLRDSHVFALGRYLKRVAGMSLSRTVSRRGHLQATRTHVDVTMALDQLDLKVRRAGLDIDPGWVPWLGKVVCFHYGESTPYE